MFYFNSLFHLSHVIEY